jgi:serine/threonine protein kinase
MPAAEPSADQFGPYEVYERLGMGGMAMVHRAKKRGPEGYERNVALKRMLQNLADDPSFVESFVREAKVASLLAHPNIAQVYDFGRIGGVYYIAMELVQGFDVRKLLRRASRRDVPIPLPVIISILGELCDALDYAHNFVDEHGTALHIVHRDISPSNLIVAHTGHLKVIDFGIAKASSIQLHTESGKAKGKLGYMSPEVMYGLPVAPVSDMFSVGVLAWELITASPLFTTRTDFETMRRVREGEIVPPSRHNSECPHDLDRLILVALEREADQRMASAAEFRAGLDAVAVRAGVTVSARSTAEWILQFAQPEDAWARASARARSGTAPPPLVLPPDVSGQLSAQPPTANIRIGSSRRDGSRSDEPILRRSEAIIQNAAEVWGSDDPIGETPGPDFSFSATELPKADLPLGSRRSVPKPTPAPPHLVETRTIVPPPSSGRSKTPSSAPPIDPSSGRSRTPSSAPPSGRSRTPSSAPSSGSSSAPPFGSSSGSSSAPPFGSSGSSPPFGSSGSSSAPPMGPSFGSSSMPPSSMPLPPMGPPSAPSIGSATTLPANVAPVASSMPPHLQQAPQRTRPSRLPLVILIVLAFVASALIAYLFIKPPSEPERLANSPLLADAKVEPKAEPKIEPIAEATPPPPTTTPTTPAPTTPPPGTVDEPPTSPKPTTPRERERPRVPKRPPTTARIETPPATTPPPVTPEPPPTTPEPTPEPIKPPPVPPAPPAPTTPGRTPVVAATAVTKLSGEVPTLRGDSDGNVLVKMCIDDTGHVTSAKPVKSAPEFASELERALVRWRYKPYVNKDGKASPACFLLGLQVVRRS